jgi:hypothetical protein
MNAPPTHANGAWRDLLLAAQQFHAMAPWRGMGDAESFGIQDRESGETAWCVVMGCGGEFFGLVAYLGDRGYDQFRRAQAEETLSDEGLYGQEALVLAYLDRDELRADSRANITRSGVTFSGRRGWPEFDRHRESCLPAPFEESDVRRMHEILQLATTLTMTLAMLGMDTPEALRPDAHGRRLVLVQERDGSLRQERRAVPAPIERPLPEFDRVKVERARSLPNSALAIECDLFPSPMFVREKGRAPYAPAMLLVTESSGGAVVHCALGEPAEREAFAQVEFVKALERLGTRPSVVYVKRRSLERVLSPLAEAIGVRLERVETLDPIEEARAFLNEQAEGS